jgi:hypothetical protein
MNGWRPLLLMAILSASCEQPIAPAYQLDRPRVLAIRAQPPELAPGGELTLDSLIYAPPGSPAPTYEWSWCATLGTGFACAISAPDLVALLDPTGSAGVSIDYALGDGAQALLPYPATAAIVEDACARAAFGRPVGVGDGGIADAGIIDLGASDAGIGDGGVDLGPPLGVSTDGGVRLTCGAAWTVEVMLTVDVGGDTLHATRQISVDWAAPASPNTNPTLAALYPFASADGGTLDLGVTVDDDGGVALQAVVPASASDVYIGTLPRSDAGAPDGGVACSSDGGAGDAGAGDGGAAVGNCYAVAEPLTLAWYVEAGTLDHATTTLPLALAGAARDLGALDDNRWVPPAGSGGSYELIVVVRDNRGGVGWLRVPAVRPVH